MRWWRISDPRWALDRTGQGMAIHGGRWNPVGVAALYAAETIALAALEKWVHLAGVAPARAFALVAVDVPEDTAAILEIPMDELPDGWDQMPSSRAAEQLGRSLLVPAGDGELPVLGFTVPSVIVPESRILVLNPAHPAMGDVTVTLVREFAFDRRMLKG